MFSLSSPEQLGGMDKTGYPFPHIKSHDRIPPRAGERQETGSLRRVNLKFDAFRLKMW